MSKLFKEAKELARSYLTQSDPDLPDDPPWQKEMDDERYEFVRQLVHRDWPRWKRGEFTPDEIEYGGLAEEVAADLAFAVSYRRSRHA